MTPTIQKTAEAYYILYQNLPAEVQKEIKKLIDETEGMNPSGITTGNKSITDLLIKGSWDDKGATYSRNELYDDSERG